MTLSSSNVRIAQILETLPLESSEEAVEKQLIIPLLQLWGYQEGDWQQQVYVGGKRLDFVVSTGDRNTSQVIYLVIEVKSPRQNLKNHSWQLTSYLRKSHSIFGLLTNGLEFELYYNKKSKIICIARLNRKEFIEQFDRLAKILGRQSSYLVTQRIESFYDAFFEGLYSRLCQLFPNSKEVVLPATDLESNSSHSKEVETMMIITIFNNKGGVGKTTMSINIAAALSKLGREVLVIDIDPQSNLTTGLGIDPMNDVEIKGRKDITHLLVDPKVKVEEVVISKTWKDIKLDIVPSHIRLSDMEPTLISLVDSDQVLAKKLKKMSPKYDYVIIDTPPSFGKVNNISLMASDRVLIPTHLAPYPIRALEYVMNRIMAVQDVRESSLSILGIAISMYSRTATRQAGNMLSEIYGILQRHPLGKEVSVLPEETWIPQRSIVASSGGRGYPLPYSEYDDQLSNQDKEAALDTFRCYMKLAEHISKLS